jgi:hypothetical protein
VRIVRERPLPCFDDPYKHGYGPRLGEYGIVEVGTRARRQGEDGSKPGGTLGVRRREPKGDYAGGKDRISDWAETKDYCF